MSFPMGRLDFGLGAGWYQHECEAYGYPFERPAARIGQLDEAVQIINGMSSGLKTTFSSRESTTRWVTEM